MSKRRNKNKKAGPVKIIRPDAPAAPAVVETPEVEADSTAEDLSAATASAESLDEGHADGAAVHQDSEPSEEISAEEVLVAEMRALEEAQAAEAIEFAERESQQHAGEPEQASSELQESVEPHQPLDEFEDASAALAQAIQMGSADVPVAAQFESIPILDASAIRFDGEEQIPASWDNLPAAASESPAADQPSASAEEAARGPVSGGKGKKDRKLKLNKLQKHARGIPEPEPEPEVVAPEPEPEPIPKAPREPRIPAFAKLTEFQSLSMAHIPGLPEETDVPGHWRGVGFGIGGRRLVSAFDEVVEIMRLPQITHVPGTQPWMLGVANVRGTLLPVVDLKQFLEGERTVMHEGQRVLVVRQAGGNVAVLIDQLFGQRTFNDTQKMGPATDSETRYGHFIKQVYRVGDNDWSVFSMSMLTRTPEFRQAAA